MKSSQTNLFAIGTLLVSLLGLCSLPLLSVVVQYMDSINGFSTGAGFYPNSSQYIFEWPLIILFIYFCSTALISIAVIVVKAIRKRKSHPTFNVQSEE